MKHKTRKESIDAMFVRKLKEHNEILNQSMQIPVADPTDRNTQKRKTKRGYE